jgi:hypothetical protein
VIGVDPRFCDRSAPILPVALGGFDGGRDSPVAKRQQGLIVGMPLRLDGEVHVVDIRHQRAQALALPVDGGGVGHRQPLIGGAWLGDQRVHAAADAADVAA